VISSWLNKQDIKPVSAKGANAPPLNRRVMVIEMLNRAQNTVLDDIKKNCVLTSNYLKNRRLMMKLAKLKLSSVLALLATLVVLAGCEPAKQAAMDMSAKERDREIGRKDGRTAEEVIAAIDSSGWAVNPLDFGMTAMDYERAEAELLFDNFAKRAGGVNKFFHFPGLTKANDRWVVSVNNDTIYSVATVDARKGFSVTVPDAGDRFLSIHIQDFNHTIVDYTWSSGTHHYPADAVDTDYVLVGIRTATDGSESDQAFVREQLQPNFKIEAGSAIPFEPKFDPKLTEKVRAALMPEYRKLPDMYGTVKYDIRAVDDWEKWTYTITGGLGLSPEDTAMYKQFAPEGTRGEVCYEASFDPIPARAFFSLTLYDKDKYLMSDDHNIISSNRKNFVARDDGGFDVIFGGMDCKSIAEDRGANFGYTPKDGWNGLVRAYRPDVEKMREYRMPQLKQID
jgi:hypothetical protein